MPYKSVYVKPEVAVKCNGYKVYHTYTDDDWEQGTSTFWFTLDENDYSEDVTMFDVRDLPNYKDKRPPSMGDVNTPENREAWKVYQANLGKMKKKVLRDAIKLEFLYKDDTGKTIVKKLQ